MWPQTTNICKACSFIILLKTSAYELLASMRGNGFVTLPLSLLPFVLLVSVPTSLISLCPFLLHFLPSSPFPPSFFSYQQVTWMPLPEGSAPPGCPPGLEYLTQIDQILVHQQIEIFECKKIHLCTNPTYMYKFIHLVSNVPQKLMEKRCRCTHNS